jgi:hypothetical protein
MFSDVAVSDACVSCHNEHADSPKSDWRLHDVMGATTWMYPAPSVSVERAIELVRALRTSIRQSYAAYLAKVATFPSRPQIGAQWPRDGFALPSEDAFMRELARRSSTSTLRALLDLESPGDSAGADLADTALDGPAPAAAAAATAQPASTPAATTATSRSDATLVIRSARATRVIVEHAGSRLLVARLVAGGVTTLSARLPLRVQVADPEGVELEYGGNKVALPERDPLERAKSVEVMIGASDQEKS